MKRLAAAFLGLTLAIPAFARPVVVELFTSQGCSSCPDADRLLSTWGSAEFQNGTVLPLSFDVDYWDYLGWKDVFSAPGWSQRQARYAAVLNDRTYTPQMVVGGSISFVGSDGAQARAAVQRLQNETARARLHLEVLRSSRAKVDVRVEPLSSKAAGLHVMLVFFESGLLTDVREGENAGRQLRNDFVVRRLIDLGPLQPPKKFQRRWEESWDSSWQKSHSGPAIFLQDPRSMAVYDARWAFPLSN